MEKEQYMLLDRGVEEGRYLSKNKQEEIPSWNRRNRYRRLRRAGNTAFRQRLPCCLSDRERDAEQLDGVL